MKRLYYQNPFYRPDSFCSRARYKGDITSSYDYLPNSVKGLVDTTATKANDWLNTSSVSAGKQAGYDKVSSLMSGDTAVSKYLTDSLSGKYLDLNNNEYYQQYQDDLSRQISDTFKTTYGQTLESANSAGAFNSSASGEMQTKAMSDYEKNLNDTLDKFASDTYSTERTAMSTDAQTGTTYESMIADLSKYMMENGDLNSADFQKKLESISNLLGGVNSGALAQTTK